MVHHPEHHGGLAADLKALADRRRVVLGLGAAALAGCGSQGGANGGATVNAQCPAAPEETEGPFPADGSSGRDGLAKNALALTGVVRRDIKPSLSGDAVAAGVPLKLTIQLVDSDHGCAPMAGRGVYVWHCDAVGRYSMYDVPEESWLRGLQVTDADGRATFETIFPGAYNDRWPHIHFEVFPEATPASYRTRIRTSQLVMPADACAAVYADAEAYPTSAANQARTPLEGDGVFRDNGAAALAAMTPRLTGTPALGYVGEVVVGYSARVTAGQRRPPASPPPDR